MNRSKQNGLKSASLSVSGLTLATVFAVSAHSAPQLEEVIVTATKCTQSLQEVGMSITALSSQDIEQSGIDSYLDFAVRIPNLGTSFQADGRFDFCYSTTREGRRARSVR